MSIKLLKWQQTISKLLNINFTPIFTRCTYSNMILMYVCNEHTFYNKTSSWDHRTEQKLHTYDPNKYKKPHTLASANNTRHCNAGPK